MSLICKDANVRIVRILSNNLNEDHLRASFKPIFRMTRPPTVKENRPRMPPYEHPEASNIALLPVLRALADPIRLEVVRHLARVEHANCAALLRDRPKSSMSHHFQVLRESGLVRTEIQGVQHLNALRREEVDARFPGLLDAVLKEQA